MPVYNNHYCIYNRAMQDITFTQIKIRMVYKILNYDDALLQNYQDRTLFPFDKNIHKLDPINPAPSY
jgi:hypothetical protein